MKRLFRYILWRIRWNWWLTHGPVIGEMYLQGIDRESQRIILKRLKDREPKP